jgi:hypothetical protein
MEIRIQFDTANAAFQEYPHGDGDFENEVKYVMAQAENFILDKKDSDILLDSNGNKVGTVWRSTADRRG